MNDLTNQVQNFNKMLTLLKYRGPDDFNIASSEHVLLGHCRLSIIDLNGGKQPFKYTYNDIEYTIVYNGEIYNMNTIKEQLIDEGYHFTSQSDTEVVVASFIAYGPRCLNLFDGIFSFVISYQNKLFVARDQLGVKPLYYYQKDDGSDNYLEIAQNICRNFTDMKLMRDRVVNKMFCEPLPQYIK